MECKPGPFHFSHSALTLSTSSGSDCQSPAAGEIGLKTSDQWKVQAGQRSQSSITILPVVSLAHLYVLTRVHAHTHTRTHTHRTWPVCLGVQSYLDTCPLGWEPRGPHSSRLCTGRSGHRSCCEGTSDTCLSGGRSSRGHWGPHCRCTDKADKASLDHVPQRGPQSSRRHRARSGHLEGTKSSRPRDHRLEAKPEAEAEIMLLPRRASLTWDPTKAGSGAGTHSKRLTLPLPVVTDSRTQAPPGAFLPVNKLARENSDGAPNHQGCGSRQALLWDQPAERCDTYNVTKFPSLAWFNFFCLFLMRTFF